MTVTRDPWADAWGSDLNSPLDRWTRVQQYGRQLGILAGEIRTVRGSLTAVDRARLLAPEMVSHRALVAGELRSLIDQAGELLALLEGTDR
jgi:hypothetical protein